MRGLIQMLTEYFTRSDLQPAVEEIEKAADTHAEFLHGVYTRRFGNRWSELCDRSVRDFTQTDPLVLEAPRGREYYEALDYQDLLQLVKDRELQPASRSKADLVEALVENEN